MTEAELKKLVAEAKARFDALTPEQQAEHREAQRQSFVRAMQPCEHGIADFEQCLDCRADAREETSNGQR